MLNDRHFERLSELLDDARAKGARVVEVGHNPADAQRRRNTLAPTIVLDARDDMRIMQEEIFGPVLPILPYRHIDEAIAYVNSRPRPLALYYFGDDDASRRKVLSRTISGNVTINGTLIHYASDDLPFGGVGASGMGAYHGIEGFRALSHAKGVFEQGRWNGATLLRPPFGALADRVLNFMLR
jgi:coniferyl-aldehyde dehydrogenase